VGCDAKVALEIHLLREENPDLFYNQVRATPSCTPHALPVRSG